MGAMRRRLVSFCAATVFATLATSGVALAQERCPTPPQRDQAALAEARGCIVALEAELGPDARQLLPELTRLGRWFSGGIGSASGGRYFQNRALRLARSAHGATSAEAAEAALNLAQATVLSGRCSGPGPEVLSQIGAAADGFAALDADHPKRRAGLVDAARAYADLLEFETAASILADAGPSGGSEWELLGDWRRRAGDVDGAVAAWLISADKSPENSAVRKRLVLAARIAAFEAGDPALLQKLAKRQKNSND